MDVFHRRPTLEFLQHTTQHAAFQRHPEPLFIFQWHSHNCPLWFVLCFYTVSLGRRGQTKQVFDMSMGKTAHCWGNKEMGKQQTAMRRDTNKFLIRNNDHKVKGKILLCKTVDIRFFTVSYLPKQDGMDWMFMWLVGWLLALPCCYGMWQIRTAYRGAVFIQPHRYTLIDKHVLPALFLLLL